MRNTVLIVYVACHIMLSSGQSHALIVTDRWTDDLNTITGFGQNSELSFAVVGPEIYKEDNLVPYISSARSDTVLAIVDNDNGETIRYFDKIFHLQEETGIWDVNFSVTNMTPYQWTGFRLEVWDSSFENILSGVMISASLTPSAPWPAIYWGGEKLVEWFDPNNCIDSQGWCQDPGETWTYSVKYDFDNVQSSYNGSFGIRQIATVPEPAYIVMLSLSFAGLGLKRNRRKTRQNRVRISNI